MTTKTLIYIGTAAPYFESAVTGRPQAWYPNQVSDVPPPQADLLLATGAFRLTRVAAPQYSLDPTGNATGLVGPDGGLVQLANRGARPRLLVFGNSLCSISNTGLQASTTTLGAIAYPGATSVQVASISGLVSGDKLGIGLYDGTVHETTISGTPSGNTVNISSALPRMARLGAGVQKYTTVALGNIRRGGGPMYMAMAQMGMPVEMIQGYGYGGGTLKEIFTDLMRVLQATRPQFVHFIDVENSVNALSSAQLIQYARAKIRACFCFGAVPLVNTAYPSNSYGAGNAAKFDAYNSWVTGAMTTEFPGAVPVDVGWQWLDSAQPTVRAPLALWAPDGIHPSASKYAVIGGYIAAALDGRIPLAQSIADSSLTDNATLAASSGGTASGMQGGSVVPSGFTYTASAGVTASSSVGPNAGSRIVMSVPGTSNISSTTLLVTQRYTFPANTGNPSQAMFGFVKLKVNQLAGVSMAYPYLLFSGGEQYSCGQETDAATDAGLLDKTFQFETPIVKVPTGATYVDVAFFIRPQTGLSDGVSVDVELLEMGLCPAAYVTH